MPYRMIQENVSRRFWEKVNKTGECWLWTGCLSDFGHGVIRIGGVLWRAHRRSWELVNGPVPDGMRVLHKCDVPACVRPDHLFLGTKADNTSDMMKKGRGRNGALSGEMVGVSVLKNSQVAAIREEYARGGITQRDLGKRYGIGQSHVSQIIRGEIWKSTTTNR